jgi:cystathionine gamma-synthase/methionine-gamma-lyase
MDSLSTRIVHESSSTEPDHAVVPPLVPAAMFELDSSDEVPFSIHGQSADEERYVYSRWANPTVRRLERRIASLEEGEDALAFASGMAAVTGLILHLVEPGDHLVVPEICYAGVAEFVREGLRGLDVQVTAADTSDSEAIEDALRPETRLVYVETPANPTLQLTDIRAVADLVHQTGGVLIVDSTIATPVATRPLTLGADFVVHSLTKYLNGHGDALGGIVVGTHRSIVELRRDAAVHLGATLSPFNAWLILRGLRSLWIRMQAHARGASQVAEFLADHPAIARVNYPGLPSHPGHEIARAQMDLFGGLLSFRLHRDSAAWARTLSGRLHLFSYAVSLGDQHSLIYYIPTDDILHTSFRLESIAAARYRAIAGEGLFRVSVGIEDPTDLCADLNRALEAAKPACQP